VPPGAHVPSVPLPPPPQVLMVQALVAVALQFRQMLNDELTNQGAESKTDEGVTAYITQTFLGNYCT